MIKHIIFDFGGVILDMGADAGVGKRTTGIPSDLADILQIPLDTMTSYWNQEKDNIVTGKETPQAFLNRVILKSKISIDSNVAYQQWEQRYALKKHQINWALVEYIQQLKSHYQIHLLTDAIDISRGNESWINDIDQLFNICFRSYEQHLRKPNPEAYINVLNTLHAKPEECVFVDDVLMNIDGAKTIGMHAILFTNLTSLQQSFAKLKI